jgi:hypothetical protein
MNSFSQIPTIILQIILFSLIMIFIFLAVYFEWQENKDNSSKKKNKKK